MSTAELNGADTKIEGIARIDRISAVFEVWPEGNAVPFAKFKVKVIERAGGDFLGVPNVAVRNPATGHPEYTSGLGKTVEEALADAIKYFLKEIKQNTPAHDLSEADFVWSASEDF